MFDDFSKSATTAQSRKRMTGSMAAASVVVLGFGAFAVVATATASEAAEEELTQVEFAPPPEPEPPPPEPEAPPPEPKPNLRPKVKRAVLKPPDEVPLEKPKESDAELAEAKDSGPLDGSLDGVEGGTGTGRAPPPPPPPPPAPKGPTRAPSIIGSDDDNRPKYPKAAERKGIEGVVVVAFDVLENGTCTNAKIVSGPVEFHEAVLKMVPKWRFKPAMRDGKPVRFRMSRPIRFRLEDA
jgi:periplasmic protein TonB